MLLLVKFSKQTVTLQSFPTTPLGACIHIIAALQDALAANPTDPTLQAALANAEAQAAKDIADQLNEQATDEAKTETFNDINPSGFTTAYNPGEFDIPTRFTTFLTNVKSSSLFSFSTSFFNSLPEGGSPIFVIDGGNTFGLHTIDLSETMAGGLAVAKAVLMALFGFLSIRAIIMKR